MDAKIGGDTQPSSKEVFMGKQQDQKELLLRSQLFSSTLSHRTPLMSLQPLSPLLDSEPRNTPPDGPTLTFIYCFKSQFWYQTHSLIFFSILRTHPLSPSAQV